jgi:hypothetical protein
MPDRRWQLMHICGRSSSGSPIGRANGSSSGTSRPRTSRGVTRTVVRSDTPGTSAVRWSGRALLSERAGKRERLLSGGGWAPELRTPRPRDVGPVPLAGGTGPQRCEGRETPNPIFRLWGAGPWPALLLCALSQHLRGIERQRGGLLSNPRQHRRHLGGMLQREQDSGHDPVVTRGTGELGGLIDLVLELGADTGTDEVALALVA